MTDKIEKIVTIEFDNHDQTLIEKYTKSGMVNVITCLRAEIEDAIQREDFEAYFIIRVKKELTQTEYENLGEYYN